MRIRRLIPQIVEQVKLSLEGLTVFTEAASGSYLWTPVLAAAAGAQDVLALAATNRYHTADEAEAETIEAARAFGVRVTVVRDKSQLGRADIVTNSGAVRPIDAAAVDQLKGTAVVPLMWEPWEFLAWQIDLAACRARGILVLGTNEHEPPCDMRPYAAPLAVHALVSAGIEVVRSRVLLLGDQPLLGAQIARVLPLLGATVVAEPPCDAVLIADHGNEDVRIPDEALDPEVPVVVITGWVDADALRARGISVWPRVIAPPGQMSASAADLGPRPVLELYAAGLRVGEVATRARLAGASTREAAETALAHAPALDFEGEHAWTS